METSVLMKAIREDPLDAQESTFPFGEPSTGHSEVTKSAKRPSSCGITIQGRGFTTT